MCFYPYSLPHADVNLSRFQVQAGQERRKGKRKEEGKRGRGKNRSRAASTSSPPTSFHMARAPPPALSRRSNSPRRRLTWGRAGRGPARPLLSPPASLRVGRSAAPRAARGSPGAPRPCPCPHPGAPAVPPAALPTRPRTLPHRPPAPLRSALRMRGGARGGAPRGAAPPGGRRPPQPGQVSPPRRSDGTEGTGWKEDR